MIERVSKRKASIKPFLDPFHVIFEKRGETKSAKTHLLCIFESVLGHFTLILFFSDQAQRYITFEDLFPENVLVGSPHEVQWILQLLLQGLQEAEGRIKK